MIIYVLQGGQLNQAGPGTIADLYPSQITCARTLDRLRLAADQKAICLPVGAMTANGLQITQEQWMSEELKKLTK